MKCAILTLLVLVAYIAQSDAVRCWTCNKENILDCDITEDQRECDGVCMKTTLGSAVTRSCAPVCPEIHGDDNGVFCCDTLLCNAATTTSSVFALTLAASVLALIYNKM